MTPHLSCLQVSKKPSCLSHIEAASIPYVAMTSWGALCVTGGLNAHNTRGKRYVSVSEWLPFHTNRLTERSRGQDFSARLRNETRRHLEDLNGRAEQRFYGIMKLFCFLGHTYVCEAQV